MIRDPRRIGWALLPLVLACGAEPRAAGTLDDRAPIILITLSGLRPDVVGALGGEAHWTPHIDALAADADWVGTAVVASSAPVVSLVSLMTGVSPWQHQVLSHDPAPPRAGLPLLAQALGEDGYHTIARVPLDYGIDEFGLLAGFDEVADSEPIEQAAAALRGLGAAPELHWLHLREANVTYLRRDVELPRLAERSAELPWQLQGWRLWSFADPLLPLPAGERELAWELFCHEVAWADHQVGEILGALRESGEWDRAWVVFTATQGTELGEHGQVLYAQNLGRASIEVPLIVKLPRGAGDAGPLVEQRRVSQLRLWSTLVEAAGRKPLPVHAPSLLHAGDPAIVSELYLRNGVNEFSLLDGDLQLLWTTRFAPAEPEFYLVQSAVAGGGPATEPPARVLDRLARAFRRSPPLSGPIGGEPPRLRLERWTQNASVQVEDPRRAAELAIRLRQRWGRFVDRERTPEEESALSGPRQ